MTTLHYIAMAGLHGCMPNLCEAHGTYDEAVDSLIDTHELGKRRAAELRQNGYIELNLHRDGNEYAEVTECDCPDLECHNDY